VNGKIYIGKTSKTAEKRLVDHFYASTQKCWSHLKLYRAFKKYGKLNFITETIFQSNDKCFIDNIEDHFINEYKARDDNYGYNMAPGGNGGDIKSPEQKRLQAEKSKLKNAEKFECKYCNKMVNKLNLKKWHDENCLLNPNVIVEKRKQPPRSEEYRKSVSLRFKNKPKTKNHIENIKLGSTKRFNKLSQKEKDEMASKMCISCICEHCGKTISKGNYTRWHGNNCKLKQ
jgi:group I intron endonuclease